MTSNVSGEASAEDRARTAFQKIRLPAAVALLAVNALWLLLGLVDLVFAPPSIGGFQAREDFSQRALFAFGDFVGLRPLLLPMLAVLLALALRPALGSVTRLIVFAALAEYAVSALFGLVAFLGSLFADVATRTLIQTALSDLGWLALLGVATLGLVWATLALLGPRKPKAPAYPGGAPWPGGQQQYGPQQTYAGDPYGQQYPGQPAYGGYEHQQQQYGQQAQPGQEQQSPYGQAAQPGQEPQNPYGQQTQEQPPYGQQSAHSPTSAVPAAPQSYGQQPAGGPAAGQQSYEQPASGVPQQSYGQRPQESSYPPPPSYPPAPYPQQPYAGPGYESPQASPPQSGAQHAPSGGQQAPATQVWPTYGAPGQPGAPSSAAPQVSSPPAPQASAPADSGANQPGPAPQTSAPPATGYGRSVVGTAAVQPATQPWFAPPPPAEPHGGGPSPHGSWAQPGAAEPAPVADPGWPTPPPERPWNAGQGGGNDDEAELTERVGQNGGVGQNGVGDDQRWRDVQERNRTWGQPDQP